MRRKSLRAFSLTLSAVMVLSVANPGVTVLATEANSAIEQQVETSVSEEETTEEVTTEAVTEEVTTETTTTEVTSEEVSTEATATEVTSEEVSTEATTAEVTPEVAAPEDTTVEANVEENIDSVVETTEEVATDDITAEIEEKRLQVQKEGEELVSTVITDGVLAQMVLEAYNTGVDDGLTLDDFTVADLAAYTGALDFSDVSNANQVKSIKGLGTAMKASSIDISACTGVTTIEEEEFQACQFTEIRLPDSVTTISDKAFQACNQLTSITLPSQLTKLGEQAFEDCTSITSINAGSQENTLPVTLTQIGQKAFNSNSSLTTITIPSFTVGGSVLQNATSIFGSCKKLETIVIGKGIQTLPASAFTYAGKESETGVTVTFEAGSQLDKILGSAFYGAEFTEGTFDLTNCTQLASVANSVFESAENLSTVILPDTSSSTLSFGKNAFAKTQLKAMYVAGAVKDYVYLPEKVTAIGEGCFYGNTTMEKIALSPNLTEIPSYAFDGCEKLSTIVQETASKVTEIGDCAFRGIAISNTQFLMNMPQLRLIGYQKLKYYGVEKESEKKVLSLPVGGNSTDILVDSEHQVTDKNKKVYGSEVFTGCNNLTEVTLPASVEQIASRAFYFENTLVSDDEKISYFTSSSQIKSITWASSTDKSKAVTRTIHSEAFAGNVLVETIVLPENQGAGESIIIEPYAFYANEKLVKVGTKADGSNKLPVTLKSIKKGAFYSCGSLTKITIEATEQGICPELGERVFMWCTSMTEATLPNDVVEIPKKFFYNAPLTTFTCGTAIEKFGDLSFFGHNFEILDLSKYSNLKEIGGNAFAHYDGLIEGDGEDKDEYWGLSWSDPKLTTVILPDRVSNSTGMLHINSGAFNSQYLFDTMKTPANGQDGHIYIPDYLKETGYAAFAGTGVKKVIWQADTTQQNQWTSIPMQLYAGCENIEKAEDVLPTSASITKIGEAAFAQSTIQTADLSHLTALAIVGDRTAKDIHGVFQGCESLTTVVFPNSAFKMNQETFKDATALNSVNLGGVTSIEKNGFEGCTSLVNITFPNTLKSVGDSAFIGCSNLAMVDFGSSLKSVGNSAFKGCSKLATVDFGSLETIGNYAFAECPELVLTKNGLPDSLITIGSSAFAKDTKLGEVSFGSNLQKISGSAFLESGLSKVDFSRAKSLTTISDSAFSKTQLTVFELSGTKVKEVGSILKDNELLRTAKFGDEVLLIKKDALAGCKNLQFLEFASTTTISTQIFYTVNSNEKYGKTGSVPGKVSITVNTPEKTIVPIGRTFYFPYYVNEKGKSDFTHILIGNESSPDTIDQYVKVRAKVTDGYYKQRQSDEADGKYKVTDPQYFEELATTPSVKVSGRSSEIDTIQMEGLKPTNGTIDFSVVCSISFESSDKIPIVADDFSANYHLEVREIAMKADLYTDDKRTLAIPAGTTETIQATAGKKGSFQCYYNMVDENLAYSTPDTYDVVVETDNPAVMYPATSSSAKAQSSYTTNATKVDSSGNITGNKNSQKFWLVCAGVGTANIKVYPKGYPQYAQTYTYTVNSDVEKISLAIPSAYKSETKPGDEFSVFSSYKTYLGQTCSADNILDFNKLTNQTIVFASNAPEYASVDQLGNVKILKADSSAKNVKITATVQNSNGKTVEATCTLKVKYPTVKKNAVVEDAATGATVQVTKTSTTDLQGEVTYQGPTDSNATEIVVPDTVTISGVQYKVTTIKDNLFKNNKKVTNITIGSYIKEIEKDAFSGCTALKSVTIGDGVEKIDQKAFYGCKKLKTVTISSKSNLKTIGVSAFQNCTALTKITIPKTVEKIDQKAFYGCKKLKTVSMSSSGKLKTIGVSAFQNCTALTKVTIPKAVEKIDKKAFYNCKKLTTATINKKGKLTTIGSSAFGKCEKLKSIVLPSKFKTLGSSAFYNCKKLKTITIKSSSLKSVGKNAFKGIHKKATIKVPKKKLSSYKKLLKGKGQKSTVKIKKG